MTAPKTSKTTRARSVPATVELPDLNGLGEAGGDPHPETGSPPDLEVIFPDPASLTILGIPATVRRLQTREIMAGIRILVNEMGTGITELDLVALMNAEDDPDKFAQAQSSLLGFLMVAAPGAADEVLKLLASLVEAKGKADAETLEAIMYNPPPAVTLDVVGVVWEQEKDDLVALMGKARLMLGYAQALQRTQRAGT